MAITIDTHPFVWHLDKKQNHKLSQKAKNAIDHEIKNGLIYIPIIVLTELLHISEKGRIKLDLDKVLSIINESEAYEIIPFDIEIFKIVEKLKNLETHDRIISATAIFKKSKLITKDSEIHDNQNIETIW